MRRQHQFWMIVLFPVLVMLFFDREAISQDDAESSGAVFEKRAAEYEFKDLSTGKSLTLRPQPLLHWGNPARNSEDGAVFVWTLDEQPCVIGTCFTYKYRENLRRKHAFQVLGEMPIEGRHRNRVVWAPPKGSLVYRPLIGAPPPTSSRASRNAQMNILARRFQVKLTQRDGRQEQCRPAQLLYPFQSEKADGPAGAIFRFAIGNDPEALLILDQRKDESGKLAWHYALARFTFYPLEGFLNGKSVWKVEESESLQANILTRPDYQREPYITFKPDWLDE